MTQLEIRQIIHEARELCWHDWDTNRDNLGISLVPRCKKCKADSKWCENPSYTSSWADFGPMLDWAMKEEWWPDFISEYGIKDTDFHIARCFLNDKYLNPLRGSTAIAEFLKERKP